MVDTDVLVDHLRGARPFAAGDEAVSYSVITRAELFAGRSANEAAIRALLSSMTELDVRRPIAERAGRLRREHQVTTPDALIAATALEQGLPLLTRNTRHFKRVPDLQLIAAP